ncbi:Deoxyguanosinetriphosphate triphosphohydrolase-like protein [gut metagenome]|uniref:Deoxyguanosinetriphosphate triphosphohydrolase-like protein n=1 Tax=gut metagenome TaxID=749906 RepID=J9H4P1_9ZZZZ
MLTVRERTQQIERTILLPGAALSENTRGRERPEEECPLRTCYQRDRDRIIHGKSFRRLKQKTQVFLSPEGDHYRTRLTHTLEVSQIARTIARALGLNEDLTEAIALGHDLGHTPFGHAGEGALNEICPGGFHHYQQSLRVVDRLEKNFEGLNLTWEVRNGIVCHTRGAWPATLEGCAVRYADRIAYMNHDIEDAVSAGVLREQDLPKEVVSVLGFTKSERITSLITNLVQNSSSQELQFSPLVGKTYEMLHEFMYTSVYVDKIAKKEEKKVRNVIRGLYSSFCRHPEQMPGGYQNIASEEGVDRAVTDYISGMSDEYATRTFEEMFVPQRWRVR